MDDILEEIEGIINDAKDESLKGVESFKQRYNFYCDVTPSFSTDEEVQAYLRSQKKELSPPDERVFERQRNAAKSTAQPWQQMLLR